MERKILDPTSTGSKTQRNIADRSQMVQYQDEKGKTRLVNFAHISDVDWDSGNNTGHPATLKVNRINGMDSISLTGQAATNFLGGLQDSGYWNPVKQQDYSPEDVFKEMFSAID